MWFECEQPFLSGERCVTSRKTAAKEASQIKSNVGFSWIGQNRSTRGKAPQSRVEDQKTQSTWDGGSGNRS